MGPLWLNGFNWLVKALFTDPFIFAVKGCPNDGNWKSSAAMPRVRVDKD